MSYLHITHLVAPLYISHNIWYYVRYIMDGFISQVQRLSNADGPGMRTTVYAVGCPMKCLWCCNPELIDEAAKLVYHPGRCIGCGACLASIDGTAKCYYDAYGKVVEIVTERELSARLLLDKPYFKQYGGGVTFSGGDPVMQTEFFCEVARLLKSAEVNVAFETSGYFPWERLKPLVEAVDLVIYDIKMLNRHLHKRYTGVDNQLILENALRVAGMRKAMIIRLILIPGVNDSEDEITGRLRFIKGLGGKVKAEVVKYRKLDADKFASLGMIEMMEGTPDCGDELAERAIYVARGLGLEVVGADCVRPS